MKLKLLVLTTLILLTFSKSFGQTNDGTVVDSNFSKNKVITFEPENYINKPFPFPTLTTIDNKTIGINELKGKPTMINFWFTACKPCIEEMPVLSNIKNQFKDSINFIAITFEPTEKAKAFLKKHKFNFTQIANAEKFIESMKMNVFPVNIFLDKDGIVRKIASGIPYIEGENGQVKMGDGKGFEIALRNLL